MKRSARLALVAVILSTALPGTMANTLTWTGASIVDPNPPNDPFWGDPFNWSPNTIPNTGDDLILNAGVQANSQNTLSSGLSLNTLTVKNHVTVGNSIALNAGLSAESAQISLGSIQLNNSQTFLAPTAGAGAVITSAITTNAKTLTLDGPGVFSLVGVISGTGAVVKTGTGTVQLAAANTYTGTTTVNDGTLLVFGSQPSSNVGVNNGQPGKIVTLGGSGTVGSVIGFTFGGALAPGALNHGTGILSINGNLSFSAVAVNPVFQVDIKGNDPGTGHDQLKVAGDIFIASPTVQLSVTLDGAFTPAPGSSFTIVRNDGANQIQGEFAGAGEGSAVVVGNTTFFITYRGGDGNDVVLHVPTTRTWDGGGADNNWMTAANWVGDVAPSVGDDLVFPAGALRLSNTNNFPAGTMFNSITASGGNSTSVGLSGNAIVLRNGVLLDSGGVSLGFASIGLQADQTFTHNGNLNILVTSPITTNGHRLTINGPQLGNQELFAATISGTGGFTMAAGKLCTLQGGGNPQANAYTGTTIISAGILRIIALQPTSSIQLEGGTLAGTGQVGPITATGGFIQPGFTGPGNLRVSGNVTMTSAATFSPGTSSSSQAGGLLVGGNGNVSLGGARLSFRDTTSANPPAIGTKFIVIDNDGTDPISGTFDALPEGSSFMIKTGFGDRTYTVSYVGGDGNDVVVTMSAFVPPPSSPTPTPSPTATPPISSTLANISTRLPVQTGDNALIGGFIITGTQAKKVILRAIGPSLPLSGVLANPTLELFSGNQLVEANDNWIDSPNKQAIIDSTIPPTNDLESAIVQTLPANGAAYTAVVRGVNNGTGIGVVEAYDLDGTVDSKLANISTRGFVQTGDNVLIAGTIILGQSSQRLMVRAIGPSLTIPGKLEDPSLELRDQNGGLIEANDNWIDSPNKQAIIDSTIPPTNDLESAIVQTLPGDGASYTAIVRGVNGTTGIAVVEIYALN